MPVTALDPRSALVVIDLQKGIAAFPTVHPMAGVIATSARLAAAFRRAQLPVVLVTVTPSADGGDRLQNRTEAPARVRAFAPDFAELVPELAGHASDLLVVKRQPNAFFGTELDLQLRRRHITNVVLTGVSTSNGVEATARGARTGVQSDVRHRRHHRHRPRGARLRAPQDLPQAGRAGDRRRDPRAAHVRR